MAARPLLEEITRCFDDCYARALNRAAPGTRRLLGGAGQGQRVVSCSVPRRPVNPVSYLQLYIHLEP